MSSRWKATVLIVFLGLTLVSTSEPSEAAPFRVTKATIKRYAPLVYLHSSETRLPMRPRDFIHESELRWNHDEGCNDHAINGGGEGEIDPSRLSDPRGYPSHSTNSPSPLHPAPFLCAHDDNNYTTADHTRPFDRLGAEGFFLDFRGDRNGSGLDVPVYYELLQNGDDRMINYWFFYAYNDFHVVLPYAPDTSQTHEGDWERITVRLNPKNNAATHVAFWNHGGYCTRRWKEVTKTKRGHPVVFSALGSHASYPAAGNYPIDVPNFPDQTDRTDSGRKWLTWHHRRNVDSASEGWYGYGGAWGEVGRSGPAQADFSGPLGPSSYKNQTSPIEGWDDRPCPVPGGIHLPPGLPL